MSCTNGWARLAVMKLSVFRTNSTDFKLTIFLRLAKDVYHFFSIWSSYSPLASSVLWALVTTPTADAIVQIHMWQGLL